jgi:hypothetical protein
VGRRRVSCFKQRDAARRRTTKRMRKKWRKRMRNLEEMLLRVVRYAAEHMAPCSSVQPGQRLT